jgi:hypothetical protein
VGLQLPGELITALGWIGYTWPEADEEKLFEMGQAWIDFSDKISSAAADAGAGATAVWSQSTGEAVQAFQRWWTGEENGPAVLQNNSPLAAVLLGAGLIICAAIVLALKIQVIVQLAILAFEVAQAIATAVATFGASLAEIPIFQMITREIVGLLIDQVIGMLLDG